MVSVASNIVPDKVAEMVRLGLAGDFLEAEKIHAYLARMFDDLFVETNPIPVKYLAARMGLCDEVWRLPMCEPSEQAKVVLEQIITDYGL